MTTSATTPLPLRYLFHSATLSVGPYYVGGRIVAKRAFALLLRYHLPFHFVVDPEARP